MTRLRPTPAATVSRGRRRARREPQGEWQHGPEEQQHARVEVVDVVAGDVQVGVRRHPEPHPYDDERGHERHEEEPDPRGEEHAQM
jgi:hypothetical protein